MKAQINKSKLLKFSGIGLIYSGSLLLIINYAFNLTCSNILLIASAMMIIIGIFIHVYILKKDSKY